MGWQNANEAINKKKLKYGNQVGNIVGVLKDFHFESLYKEISPIVLLLDIKNFNSISVRITADNIENTLTFLEKLWTTKYRPNYPFSYSFIEDRIQRSYYGLEVESKIMMAASIIAILIACLGLLGLSAFLTNQRTKEIGIRKILGCSVSKIVYMQTKDFSRWVIVANIFAWPFAFFFMNQWLQTFAYRITLSWWIFVLAGGATLLIALLTISWQAIRAAIANPVESLRYE